MSKKEYWDKLWAGASRLEHKVADLEYLAPELYRALEKYAQPEKPVRFLEAGCGIGFWNFLLRDMENLEFSVGVDISDCLYQVQVEKLQLGASHLHFMKADVRRLPFQERSFTLLTSLGVIEHFPDPKPLLLEIKRVLASGGLLFLDTPNKGLWAWRTRLFPLPEHEDYYRPEELAQLLEDCGFNVLEYYAKGFSNTIMTILCQMYDYRADSLLSRGYHYLLGYLKRGLMLLDPWLDKRYGFYSIVVAVKP